jgi:hypothetical protein
MHKKAGDTLIAGQVRKYAIFTQLWPVTNVEIQENQGSATAYSSGLK